MSSLTSTLFSPNVRGRDNWGCGWTLRPVVTVLSTMGTLIQPFALINQSLSHIPVHLRMLGFCGSCKPLRSIAGLLLPWACGLFLLPLSLSLSSMPVIALCPFRRMRLLLCVAYENWKHLQVGGQFDSVGLGNPYIQLDGGFSWTMQR